MNVIKYKAIKHPDIDFHYGKCNPRNFSTDTFGKSAPQQRNLKCVQNTRSLGVNINSLQGKKQLK